MGNLIVQRRTSLIHILLFNYRAKVREFKTMHNLQIFLRIHLKIISYAALFFEIIVIGPNGNAQDVFMEEVHLHGTGYRTYPFTYEHKPDLPSPFLSDEKREIVLLKSKNKSYALLDVTQEKGHPFNYQGITRGKGNQIFVDTLDFPTLAFTGLHSEVELSQIQSITGLSVAEISYQGRPGRLSGAGFMAEDEDILSVLRGDNRLVSAMGLTHRNLSKPLFHLWNAVLYWIDYDKRGILSSAGGADSLFYDGKKIWYVAPNCRGWQYSLFNDSIQGECHLELRVDLSEEDRLFVDSHFMDLPDEKKNRLIEQLTHLHTGEMSAYYIQYYGFYEGHTDYRADPVSLAFIFGLKSMEELYETFGTGLFDRINDHHTSHVE